ncbi:hypothetical protein F2Q69_00059460 [Brassica cretica]|uniref:Uncharacterized protein n=1 Tax=Brassica cretica TaxID=69181 RepID=A0A8S9RB70_BRACR|nr:hypothetical protein F2Q69_00059460 [Brassica cretica]
MATHNMHTEEYDEDYEEERAIEQRAILDEEDTLLHHSSWKKKLLSIDRYGSKSIDTQPHQPNHLRASTDIAYFPSIDTNADATRDGDYSIGSWADDRYHESYAVETEYRDQGADELHEGTQIWLRKSNRRTHIARISRRYRRHPSDSQWSRQSVHASTQHSITPTGVYKGVL